MGMIGFGILFLIFYVWIIDRRLTGERAETAGKLKEIEGELKDMRAEISELAPIISEVNDRLYDVKASTDRLDDIQLSISSLGDDVMVRLLDIRYPSSPDS